MMPLVINVLVFLWGALMLKYILFWIFLWQLKNYHVGRFLDHFRTDQGKKLISGPLLIIKLAVVLLMVVNNIFLYVLLLIYLAQSLLFIKSIVKKNVRKPVFTFKAILLILILIAGAFLATYFAYTLLSAQWFACYLLVFDILIPTVVTFVVLAVQPFFVAARNRILQQARQKIATMKNLTVIAITGSYGKTSTKEFLTTILSSKFKVLSTPDHKNAEIGIAQTILESLNENHQMFIVEMGSYNKGGIKLLCDMVKPHMGIVTGVNQQHLATFGTLENLLSAEGGGELAEALPKNGLMILNGDNKYCVDLYKTLQMPKKLYTVKKDTVDSDIWTEDVEVAKESISFIARSRAGELAHVAVNVLGKQNVQNLLGAILAAKELGMGFDQITQACKNIVPAQAGMALKTGIHGINIIDSSYSSNPDGVMADLDYLHIFEGKKVIVMPCLIELGVKSKEVHHQIGKKIAQICDMAIITTGDKFKEIKMGATENGMAGHQIILCDKPAEILAHITTFCKQGDAVLLEGRVPSELIRLLNGKQI